METNVISDETEKKEDDVIPEKAEVIPGQAVESLNIGTQVRAETIPTTEAIKIENGKNKMKIKCVKCGLEEELNNEDVKLLAHIVRRYNTKPSPVDYIGVLSIIKGKCKDDGKHVIVFHEDFDKAVAGMIHEYNNAIAANVARKETLEKTAHLIIETDNQIKSLESMLQELEKKKEYILSEMSTGGILINNIKLKFEKLTGTPDTEMWS